LTKNKELGYLYSKRKEKHRLNSQM